MKAEKREVFNFRQAVTNGSPVTLERTIYKNARVKKIKTIFPDGEDGDLHVKVWAIDSYESPIDLINIIGDQEYLSGNGSDAEFQIDVPLSAYSKLFVSGDNKEPLSQTDDKYKYPILVDIEVEYYG